MMLTHICPSCGKKHEMDCTPEPSQECPECRRKMGIKLKIELSYDSWRALNDYWLMDKAVGLNKEATLSAIERDVYEKFKPERDTVAEEMGEGDERKLLLRHLQKSLKKG